MPDNSRRWISAGEDMAQVARLLTDGYTPGGIAGAISAGSYAGLKRMYGVKTTAIQLPEPEAVTITGDDTRLGVFMFDSPNLPTFEVTTGEVDQDIVGASQGTSLYTIGTYYDVGLMGPVGRDFNDMFLAITAQARSRVSGNKGAGFHSLIVPSCQMTYRGRNWEERAAATFSWSAQVNPFDRFPWGGLLANNTFGKDEGLMFEFFTNKRPQFLTIVDNAVISSALLDYIPWTDGNGNVRFIAWRNGTVIGSTGNTTLISITAATKTVNLGSLTGRVSGDKIFIFAEVA